MSPAEAEPAPTNLREAHAHIFQLGRSLSMAQLSACACADEMLEALAQHARALKPGDWVLAHGARPDAWDNPAWPTRTELDHACGDRSVVAWCFDYHALVASSAALGNAEINRHSRFENGRVELDTDGQPTGLLIEEAALAMWTRVPEPPNAQRRDMVRRACLHLQSLGYEEVHDLKAQPWLGVVLTELLEAGEIGMRFQLFPLVSDLDASLAAQRDGLSDAVSIAGGKIFVDGTLSSRTALMLAPFADGNPAYPSGTAMMNATAIDEALIQCRIHALPLAAHAIGDGAVRMTLDAIERTGCAGTGCRIEHAEVIDKLDVGRFAGLGVIASLQPCHLLPDIEALRRALPHRLDRVLPIKELIESGLRPGVDLLFGSDAPIVGADPHDSVVAATQRRRAGMDKALAINPEQAIDEATAWACFGAR